MGLGGTRCFDLGRFAPQFRQVTAGEPATSRFQSLFDNREAEELDRVGRARGAFSHRCLQ